MGYLKIISRWVFAIIRWCIGLWIIALALVCFFFSLGVLIWPWFNPTIYYTQGTVLETHKMAEGRNAVTVKFMANDGKEYKAFTTSSKNVSPKDKVSISYGYPNPQVGADLETRQGRMIIFLLMFGGGLLAGLMLLLIGYSLISKRIWRIWQVGPALPIPSGLKKLHQIKERCITTS